MGAADRAGLSAYRDMQLAQRVKDRQNRCEIWMLWTTGKRAIDGLPCYPAFVGDVRDVAVAVSRADGLANLGDVRVLKGPDLM